MKIKFQGHSITDCEVEFSKDDQVRLFEIMKQEFIEHITYSRFNSSYPTHTERQLENFCNGYGVDIEYSKDRIAFFTAVLDALKNPYQ
jgi:hypothetical protein